MFKNKINPTILIIEILDQVDWLGIILTGSVPFWYLEYCKEKGYILDRHWIYLSDHPEFTTEYFESHPEYEWNMSFFSRNRNVTLDYINSHPKLAWDWGYVMENPNLTISDCEAIRDKVAEITFYEKMGKRVDMKYLEDHINEPWICLESNKNLTIKFFEAHPEFRWDWIWLSYNPNIPIEYIESHPTLPWNFNSISQNRPIDYLINHPRVDFYALSLNPNLTLKDILENKVNWDWTNLSNNPMNRVPAQKIIARTWRRYKMRQKAKILQEIYKFDDAIVENIANY